MASGLDERVKAAVLCGWTNTFQGSILAMHHCIDNYLPGILLDAEQPELAGLIAPRALFVESGEQDRIFPAGHVRQAISILEETYAAWGVQEQLAYDIHSGGHEISGKKLIWLAVWEAELPEHRNVAWLNSSPRTADSRTAGVSAKAQVMDKI
ncbi:hypothetical protein D3C76_143240 [compost metagenome]